jgi:hypothetical protein
MSSDERIHREEFHTEGEAIAFTEGLDFVDSDHLSYEPPYVEGEMWVVEVRRFA